MSVPPVIVQIKRKATDEPVDLLRVHELNNPRKRRATDFVFSLQSNPDVSEPDQSTLPAIRKVKQIHRSASASSQDLGASSAPVSRFDTPDIENVLQSSAPPEKGNTPIDSAPATSPGTPNSFADTPQLPLKAIQPRRFHISRSCTPSILDPVGGIRRRKAEPTVFVERRSRPKNQEGQSASDNGSLTLGAFNESPRPQKKPGLAARTSTPPVKSSLPKPGVAPLRNVRMPSGQVIPWDVSSEQLVAEMQAYTLQEIGDNLAASQAPRSDPKQTSSHIHKYTPSKFKPKAPALRYAQRHPEEQSHQPDEMAMDLDGPYVEDEVDSDSEYVIDTYIRMPADSLQTEDAPKNIGFLILDSQPDIDEFYREDEDTDEEDDEDEDENAENHYTADYPDDEVDSDDEFDRNAYHYRTHNASDLEEFDGADGEDMTFSDDENESTRYPWMTKKPWLLRPKNGIAGNEVDDE